MYYVIAPDGSKYGPADLSTLQQWKAEQRLFATTELEDASTGQRLQAGSIPVLFPPNQVQAPGAPYLGPGSPYAQAPVYSQAAMNDSGAQKLVNQTYVYSVLSLLCCPLLFGILGWNTATRAEAMGHPNATQAKYILLGCTIASIVIGALSAIARR